MSDDVNDEPEFTDDQLRAALRRVGEDARQEAFAAGLSVLVLRGRAIVSVHPDGSEEVVDYLANGTDAGTKE